MVVRLLRVAFRVLHPQGAFSKKADIGSTQRASELSFSQTPHRPCLAVLGQGTIIDVIHSATATLAVSHRVPNPAQLAGRQRDVSAVIMCGCPGRISKWYKLLPNTLATVGALRRASSQSVARLLDLGMNEVVTCQMSTVEITARIRAVIKPSVGSRVAGDLAPLPSPRRAQIVLYDYFRKHPRRVIGQRELMEQVLGGAHAPDTSLVRVHIAALRKILGGGGHEIRTIRGLGYYYLPSNAETPGAHALLHLETADSLLVRAP
jgi:Transcriptional regulatory protein, C terminal